MGALAAFVLVVGYLVCFRVSVSMCSCFLPRGPFDYHTGVLLASSRERPRLLLHTLSCPGHSRLGPSHYLCRGASMYLPQDSDPLIPLTTPQHELASVDVVASDVWDAT